MTAQAPHEHDGPTTAADLAEQVLAAAPHAMRERRQWLLWRFETYQGDTKPRKVPYYVSGRKRRGAQGSPEDREELQTLEIALAHLARGQQAHWDGVGFAFLPGDGLIGIDIDGAIDDEGVVSERCQGIIQACASYTEFSPSGRGVHIICAGESETFKDNRIGLEVFAGRQYFTFTGRRWPGTPEQVQPIGDGVLRRLRATVKQAKEPRAAAEPRTAEPAAERSDDFARVNAAALALLDQWVPLLFPTAGRQTGTRAWRVRSRDLGRDLQEDLALHPDGIRDWGEERGMTPIDVVVRWGNKRTGEALRWLADAIGMRLAKMPRARAGAAPPAAAAERSSTPTSGSAGDGGPPGGDAPPGAPGPLATALGAASGGGGDDWRDLLLRERGGARDCRENVFITLQNHPELRGVVGYDEFSHRVWKLKDPPWDSKPGEWTNDDDYSLGYYLARRERLVIRSEATLVAGVAMAAFANRFNPLVDYLEGLPPWDKIERAGHWLSDCMGAEESDYTRLVGTWFLMGMVKRALDPGCQMDYVVVLEGLQGKRKSTALRVLVGRDDWFADTPIRIGDKDAMLSLAGKWLYEIGELDSFNKAEVTAVKQYITSRIDRVREPFARRPADRRRTCVFGATTNQAEYFRDPTGSRRFWPMACDGEIDVEKLAQWRDQLYAEALHRLRSEDSDTRRYYPTREETERWLVPQQERREIGDPWFEKLAAWLESRQQFGETGLEIREVDSLTSFELLTKALNVPMDRIDGGRQMATRVGIAMHKLGWQKRRDAGGARVWRYWRPATRHAAGNGSVVPPPDGAPAPQAGDGVGDGVEPPGGPGGQVDREALHEF